MQGWSLKAAASFLVSLVLARLFVLWMLAIIDVLLPDSPMGIDSMLRNEPTSNPFGDDPR
jgi:hypothetical protein